jgi:hypothetical protein
MATVPFPIYPPSQWERISFGTQPGTLSVANFQGRFATARMLKKVLPTINVEETKMSRAKDANKAEGKPTLPIAIFVLFTRNIPLPNFYVSLPGSGATFVSA